MARRDARWGSRLVEWGILALVILILAGIFGSYAYRVQGQAERAAIVSTLGALRTALVVDHLKRVASGAAQETPQDGNPFGVLQRLPANYTGLLPGQQWEDVAPGQWVFDAVCDCVGYRPMHPEWLDYPESAQMLWYQVAKGTGGLRELRATQPYRWQGHVIE